MATTSMFYSIIVYSMVCPIIVNSIIYFAIVNSMIYFAIVMIIVTCYIINKAIAIICFATKHLTHL